MRPVNVIFSGLPWLLPRIGLACACLVSLAAAAQASGALSEIIVYSTLRDSELIELPGRVTVLDATELQMASVRHFEQAMQLVPNMNWSGEGTRARFFQLRGIGELEQYEGAPNPSVGLIVDDIDYSGIGGLASTFDISQVEVLSGPQGTRYGANALAGLIFMRSTDPGDVREAFIESTLGNDETWSIGAAAGGPLRTDGSLGFRVAAQLNNSNGFRDNLFLGRDDTYGRDEFIGRGKLRWTPGDNWQIDFAAVYADLDNGYDAFAINNGFNTYSDKPGEDSQQSGGASLRAAGELSPAVTLVSISSYSGTNLVNSFDADWGNDEFWAPYIYDFFQSFDRDRDTFSQEFRLQSTEQGRLFGGSTAWVAGAYWLRLNESLNRFDFGRDDFFCPVPCTDTFASDYRADNIAFFGELSTGIGPATTLSAGLRWERRNTGYRDSNAAQFDPSDTMLGGDISLVQALSESASVFARIARGYKAGGFNLDPNVAPGDIVFMPEYLWSYELGARLRGESDRWLLDVTYFFQDREDLQVKIPLQDELGNPSAFFFFTDNAEAGKNFGLEFSAEWQPLASLRFHAAIGLLRTEIDRFSYDPAIEGRDQAHAPEYTFNVGATWAGSGGWSARLDIAGKDAFFFDYGHNARSESYELVNASIGRDWDRWSLRLWARNIFDRRYPVRGFFFGNEPPDFPPRTYLRLGDPRHFGLTVNFRI